MKRVETIIRPLLWQYIITDADCQSLQHPHPRVVIVGSSDDPIVPSAQDSSNPRH